MRFAAFVAALLLFFSIVTSGHESRAGATASVPFQAAFSALVPCCGIPGGQVFIDGPTSVFTWQRVLLPYTVPDGKQLEITDVHFGSKHVASGADERSSYLIIDNVMTVTEFGPNLDLTVPFIVPAGHTLNVSFINNSPEAQWMNGFILGRLSDAVDVVVPVNTPAPTSTGTPVPTATPTTVPLPTATPTPCPWWAPHCNGSASPSLVPSQARAA